MRMRHSLLVLAFCLCAVPALAQELETPPAASLEERLKRLEEHQAELYHSLAQKKATGLAEQLSEHLSVSGLLEVEATAGEIEYAAGSSDAASDLTLATAQLGFDMKLNETVGGNLIFLYEEGGDLEVDEAAIVLERGPWFARVGRQYVPFGVYNSHFISDPLTLELGETRATALVTGYKNERFNLSAFAFNGVLDKDGREDHINDGGVSLSVTPLDGLEFGGSYLADLAESNAELLGAPYARRVDGWSAYATLAYGAFGVSAEALGAARSFVATDLAGRDSGHGARPLAWNLEVAYRPVTTLELALRYEGSDEFAGQPERQYGAAVSWGPWEHVTLALEYLHGTFDHRFAGDLVSSSGSPADTRNQVTMQLALAY